MRRLLSTTFLAAALPALATAQERLTIFDLFSIDALLQRAMQSGVMALRTQLDLVYGGMSVDILTGKITMTEVKAWPLPEWDAYGSCEVGIDRITARSGALDQIEELRLKFQLVGVTMPLSCLPPDLQELANEVGIGALDIPRVTFDVVYGLPASDAEVRLHADFDNLGSIDLNADFAYLWIDGREDIEEPTPIMFLEHAALRYHDKGLYAKVAPLLPPPLAGEGAGLFIEGALGQELIAANRAASADAAAELTPEQEAFLASLSSAWPAFAAEPGALVLETTMEQDVFLDLELLEDDPTEAFAALKPIVSRTSAAANAILPVALLQGAIDGGSGALSVEDRKRLGLALITGTGAPRNLARGKTLLEGLAELGDGEAAAALATALAATAPSEAYRWALLGGQVGEKGMVTLLDRLEREMAFGEILTQQAAIPDADTLTSGPLSSLSGVRSEAAMRLSGNGRARSYALAAAWAIIGAAAGDAESADILADIEERVRLSGAAALTAWKSAEESAADMAMQAWISEGLAARYAQ